jgi:Domain of unknown function (DUF4349)
MRVIPFPDPGGRRDEPTLAEIDAALRGEAVGADAEQWRRLRADVRALAPPLPPELQRRLRERIERSWPAEHRREPALTRPRAALTRLRDRLGHGRRAWALATLGPVVAAAVVALVVVAPWRASTPPIQGQFSSQLGTSTRGAVESAGASPAVAEPAKAGVQNKALPDLEQAPQAQSSNSGAVGAGAPAAAAGTPARVQERAASVTLAPRPQDVQSVADQVSQLAGRFGGFVQRSQVSLQPRGQSSATLVLQLPSAKLVTAIGSLAQLAPMRAESQSLQDITSEYDAARTKLSDAVAERQALLRALARATTQGQIESLRERLSLAGAAVVRARSAFETLAKRGSSSTVEVSVSGDAHAAGGGTTLNRGLDDAGHVLTTALAVLLVALAVLAPLAIVAALVALGSRSLRRRLRERALS